MPFLVVPLVAITASHNTTAQRVSTSLPTTSPMRVILSSTVPCTSTKCPTRLLERRCALLRTRSRSGRSSPLILRTRHVSFTTRWGLRRTASTVPEANNGRFQNWWWFALAGIPGGLLWLGMNAAVGRPWQSGLVPGLLFALVFGVVMVIGRGGIRPP